MTAPTQPTTSTKGADDVLEWMWNWRSRPFLEPDETIETSEFIVADGITVDRVSNTTDTATVWLRGGTVGQRYRITNRITTSAGRQKDWSFTLSIRDQ